MKCSICDVDLTTVNNGCSFDITTEICISIDIGKKSKDYQRAKDMFGVTKFNICHCCVLKALGVKPI